MKSMSIPRPVLNAKDCGITGEERLSQWYNQARMGLFIHWGMMTGDYTEDPLGPNAQCPYQTVEEFEQAVLDAGWSADKWVRMAKEMKAQYISLATFHGGLGYLKTWRSQIPGSACTKRDYLGELLEAAQKEDIKVIVYATRTSKPVSMGITWLHKELYSAYKGNPEIDIATREGYLFYLVDVLEELICNYPALSGLWFDGWFEGEEAREVYRHLHSFMPNGIIIRNNFSTGPVADEDVMSIEDFGKAFYPAYDYASGAWVGPGKREYCMKTIWDWMYMGSGKEDWEYYEENYKTIPSNQELIKRIVSVIGSSWTPSLGFGPLISGDLPEPLAKFHKHLCDFMSWAEEAIFGTEGGGYDKGGFTPGYWKKGAYGVTTLLPGGNTHYIHVMEKPSGEGLQIPDAGYDVVEAVDLYSQQRLDFYQENGEVSISVPSWKILEDTGVQIIQLKTMDTRRVVSKGLLTVKAEIGGKELNAAVIDGDYKTCFATEETDALPVSMILELKEETEINGLIISQPEVSSIVPGNFKVYPSIRVREYELYASDEETCWGEPISRGELKNQRGYQVIHVGAKKSRFYKLMILNNYSDSNLIKIGALDLIISK